MSALPVLLVVGNGMVGHRFVELAIERGLGARFRIVVIGEEPRAAYDRVHLSSFFEGKSADDLALTTPAKYAAAGVTLELGERVLGLDLGARAVRLSVSRTLSYDKLVLATGAAPFVPPVPGRDLPGCFVYRTIEDLEAIRAHAAGARVGAVIGGGLLGLEAASALKNLGLETHVVELAPRLMALQVDEAGGAILRRKVESLGVHVHTSAATAQVVEREGRAAGLRFADGSELHADLVVFSAGIRPRDELARAAGLALGERGGVAIDDRCATSDPDVLAVGECAAHAGRVYGLVAPGYQMARAAVDALAGGDERFTGFDMSAKLKLLGVDVASFGDAQGVTPGAKTLSYFDAVAQVYRRVTLDAEGKRLLGGVLVGDASGYGELTALARAGSPVPPHPEDLVLPPSRGASSGSGGPAALPAEAILCSCHNVSKGAVCQAITGGGLQEVSAIKACTRAGTGCGSCVPLLGKLLEIELRKAGVTVADHVCEHFPHSRQELYSLVRLHRLRSFDELLAQHGRGAGCEICKPAVASILASAWNEHVLDRRHRKLQDTNDRFLANIQKDGTYSVIPRVPAGEITPDQLITLGQVAKRHGLYTKITGGQRVDLLGARVEQLPEIWRELIAAGFESGHAYGKALRTVKSCVGSTWCRYGVQDSVGLALRLEHRYKGLRAPHKLKSAVSGCARECAEAQGKDFGVIATDKGYNLYVCGNGGMKPRHADLLCTDLDEDTLVRYVDRFLMFYVRTADRLQRTSTWLESLEGGLDYLRQVVVEDSLGIAAELEAEMAAVVGTYRCEWRATLEDPEKLRQFRAFVNATGPDPSIVMIREREQPRPATPEEKVALRKTG
jgi:nitrite reductase (NADH) large subunit